MYNFLAISMVLTVKERCFAHAYTHKMNCRRAWLFNEKGGVARSENLTS